MKLMKFIRNTARIAACVTNLTKLDFISLDLLNMTLLAKKTKNRITLMP